MEQSTKNVNLWNTDKKIVEKFAEDKGLNFSAALRIIIREWHESKRNKKAKETAPKA